MKLKGNTMLTTLTPAVTKLASGYLATCKEKVVAKIEAQVTKVQSDANWEEVAMKASDNSIKDELWTCAFILLIAACMWPDAQPYIREGFLVLKNDCPEWLSWGILASIAASFGIKSIGQFKK